MKFEIPKTKKKKRPVIREKAKAIAVDFDGVIHDFRNPIPGRRMGPPIYGTKQALEYLKKKGYEIIVFTVWGDDEGQGTIEDFMKYYGLPFDRITNIKPQAEYYIDDRAIQFSNWKGVFSIV